MTTGYSITPGAPVAGRLERVWLLAIRLAIVIA